MPDSSPCKTKKKFTIIASQQGVETAERTLMRLGFDSKSNFAKSQRLGRSTVTNFFNQIPIQLDSFKRICDALKLKWEEIAGITQESLINHEPREIQVNARPDIEEGVQQKMLGRQVTVIDKHSQGIKAVITLQGDISLISDPQILEAILKKYGGDSIHITDIQKGSIKLIIEGSQEDIERLLIQIQSGELTELDGFPVEDAQILSESSEDDESSEQKWSLVEEIVTNQIIGRDLSGVDLSDADLSGACLTYANLSGANLSGADLSGAKLRTAKLRSADLSGADLSGAKLRSADLSGANLSLANLSLANLRSADLRSADLRSADLSFADLRSADLSGADLSFANLSGADLSSIQVEKTRFRHNLGITEELKKDLIKRGAIFEDSPGDRSRILSRV
ncbi:MAG: pentapeptide repeat-containing protein [Microcoleus sp. PH2017_22_RUC_O_B]|uniref:pentapeptide repeat-containing protein n=1 Tax=unclassified Microcoleus TaxID=2642155 RepID=UPI001D8784BB|nr:MULTISPECIES: pentapeptide repeat-containing protein [unclassified Microcoleus]MCC3531410.1 pentapeptide repeat-containing protein [Microcoleus sp. PH2017_21_RUC_O_A]MCC3543716.1 pentapeptide repeat-containing protein [Microcoleus sp. PH2017_22_RUC_O_B]